MATRPKSSRRNRKFGPNPALDGENSLHNILSPTSTEPTNSPVGPTFSAVGSTDSSEEPVSSFIEPSIEPSFSSLNNQSFSDELSELKKRGILPDDFPSHDGDIADLVNPVEDITNELDKLLQIGAISSGDVAELKVSKKRDELNRNENPIFSVTNDEIPDFDERGLPKNWSEYDTTSEVYVLIELGRGDPEFKNIEQEFRNAHIQVKKIERLQNKRILDRFKSEADDLSRHRSGDFCLNIKYLYHGTNVKKETLCEEGLDQRLSRMGYFGRGIYFSDNPLKCVHYSEDIKQAGPYEAYILKCRVILGDVKVFPKGASNIDLKREPEKETPSHGSKYYDSVLGCPKDFNEYVVYENRRAMIEYIITFQADDDIIKHLRQISKTGPTGASLEIKEIIDTESIPEVHRDRNTDDSPPSPEGPESQDDHFSRISDVREAVRKKRLGATYVPPSREQRKKEKEMWKEIQKLQGVQHEAWGKMVGTDKSSTFQSNKEKSPPVIMWGNESNEEMQEDPEFSFNWKDSYGEKWEKSSQSNRNTSQQSRQRSQNTDDLSQSLNKFSELWLDSWNTSSVICSDTSNNQGMLDDNPVEQVLSVCLAEFLSVTGLEDSGLAKHYVMKAEMDLNRAISMYYEDIL